MATHTVRAIHNVLTWLPGFSKDASLERRLVQEFSREPLDADLKSERVLSGES